MNADILKSLVECPVCFQVPRGKILACSNSHKVCETCFDQISTSKKQCPQGNCPYDQPPRRYRELEAIVENANIDFSCSYAKDGCNVEMEKETLKELMRLSAVIEKCLVLTLDVKSLLESTSTVPTRKYSNFLHQG